MHKITKIQLQSKNKNRVNIFIDDVYCFSCEKEIALKHKLKEGLQVDKEYLENIIEESNEKKAFQLAIHYLSFRPRTYNEVTEYLLKKEYDNAIINKVLDKLIYYKYIDDKQYTKSYILNAIEGRRKSVNTIKLELTKKGISQEIIEEYSALFSTDINLDIAKEISNKYFTQKSNLPFNQLKNKLSQLLARKGFSWEIINECLDDLNNNTQVQLTIDSNLEQYQSQTIKLAKKYFSKYTKKEDNPYILEKKVKHALYQKGYDMDIIDFAFESIKKNNS